MNTLLTDTSCSYGNLAISTSEIEVLNPSGNEIGKEDIRIPISIDYDRSPQKTVLLGNGQCRIDTATCEITGLVYRMAGPNIGLEFYWKSPLAVMRNAIKVSLLPISQLCKLDLAVIAGSILSILANINLAEGKAPAKEKNDILVSLLDIQESIDFLISVRKIADKVADNRKKLEDLPQLCLNRTIDKDNLANWQNECWSVLMPAKQVITQADIDLAEIETERDAVVKVKMAVRKAKVEKAGMSVRVKAQAKPIIDRLLADKIIGMKAADAFKYLCIGDNATSVSKEQINKYVGFLSAKKNLDCEHLAQCFRNIIVSNDDISLEDTVETTETTEKAETVETVEKKMTLLEIIAARKAGK